MDKPTMYSHYDIRRVLDQDGYLSLTVCWVRFCMTKRCLDVRSNLQCSLV